MHNADEKALMRTKSVHYPARAALERKKTAIFVFWRPQNAGFSMGNLIANQGRRSFFFAADVSKKRYSRHEMASESTRNGPEAT